MGELRALFVVALGGRLRGGFSLRGERLLVLVPRGLDLVGRLLGRSLRGVGVRGVSLVGLLLGRLVGRLRGLGARSVLLGEGDL